MSKKKSTGLIGFITAMSPQKSNSFIFDIQTDGSGRVRKAICFDNTKYQMVKEQKNVI